MAAIDLIRRPEINPVDQLGSLVFGVFLIAAMACFDALEFEPSNNDTTDDGCDGADQELSEFNPIGPRKYASTKIAPAAMATLDNSMAFRHRSKTVRQAVSISASRREI